VGWQPSKRQLSQSWLQVREESRKVDLATSWHHARTYCLNMATWAHFLQKKSPVFHLQPSFFLAAGCEILPPKIKTYWSQLSLKVNQMASHDVTFKLLPDF